MNAGILDRYITIQRQITGLNDYNEETKVRWEDVDEIWAAKNFNQGNESYLADQLVSEDVVRWIARYRTDLSADMRIVDEDGLVYEIQNIQELSGKKYGRREAIEIKTYLRDNHEPEIVVKIDEVGTVSVSDPEFILTVNYAGGTWSGTGITNPINGTFNPATAGIGTHQINYNYFGNTDTILIKVE